MTIAPGSEVAGYRIEAELGRGGMGVVYRAVHPGLKRRVALKVVQPLLADDPAFRSRFQREWETAASIEHPHVVPVHEAGEADGRLFIAMRLVEGSDLSALLHAEGALEPARAAALTAQIGSALDAAHARGLVHRDVKPANVLVARDGPRDHGYLTDFGLARVAAATGAVTATGTFIGTPDYAAPEQLTGDRVDARADVFALGCVLFAMLTGRPPFPRETHMAAMWAHVNAPTPATGLGGGWDAVLSRALAKRPADRYPSAGDLARAAQAAAAESDVALPERAVARGEAALVDEAAMRPLPPVDVTRPTRALPAAPPPPRRRRGGAFLAGLVGGIVALVVGGLVVPLILLRAADGPVDPFPDLTVGIPEETPAAVDPDPPQEERPRRRRGDREEPRREQPANSPGTSTPSPPASFCESIPREFRDFCENGEIRSAPAPTPEEFIGRLVSPGSSGGEVPQPPQLPGFPGPSEG